MSIILYKGLVHLLLSIEYPILSIEIVTLLSLRKDYLSFMNVIKYILKKVQNVSAKGLHQLYETRQKSHAIYIST